jgi:hypothetical protein
MFEQRKGTLKFNDTLWKLLWSRSQETLHCVAWIWWWAAKAACRPIVSTDSKAAGMARLSPKLCFFKQFTIIFLHRRLQKRHKLIPKMEIIYIQDPPSTQDSRSAVLVSVLVV